MTTYDFAIVGGGLKGAAGFFACTYTNARNVVLIEQYGNAGLVNSNMLMNSQTLHDGSIETNYEPERALRVKRLSELTRIYLDRYDASGAMHSEYHKMVIGVGQEEAAFLEWRFSQIREFYENIELIGFDKIGELEPKVVEGRSSRELKAVYSSKGKAVDYGMLAQSLVQRTLEKREGFSTLFDHKVNADGIRRDGLEYVIETEGEEVRAKIVLVCAGAASLLFAKNLDYGLEYSVLPVAGSFYYANEKLLDGKVYTVQNPAIPFAAVHGDPEAHDQRVTRFGPTAMVVPLTERRNYATLLDFIQTGSLGVKSLLTYKELIIDDPVFREFMIQNVRYSLPNGRNLFAEAVRKIVPTLEADDLRFAKGVGGLRPQLIDVRNRRIAPESKITGENILFSLAPPTGASLCLGDSFEDIQAIISGTGLQFDRRRFEEDFKE